MVTLAKATDCAIARVNRAYEATLCQRCAGTGRLYPPDGEGRYQGPVRCDRCHGTGHREGGR